MLSGLTAHGRQGSHLAGRSSCAAQGLAGHSQPCIYTSAANREVPRTRAPVEEQNKVPPGPPAPVAQALTARSPGPAWSGAQSSAVSPLPDGRDPNCKGSGSLFLPRAGGWGCPAAPPAGKRERAVERGVALARRTPQTTPGPPHKGSMSTTHARHAWAWYQGADQARPTDPQSPLLHSKCRSKHGEAPSTWGTTTWRQPRQANSMQEQGRHGTAALPPEPAGKQTGSRSLAEVLGPTPRSARAQPTCNLGRTGVVARTWRGWRRGRPAGSWDSSGRHRTGRGGEGRQRWPVHPALPMPLC